MRAHIIVLGSAAPAHDAWLTNVANSIPVRTVFPSQLRRYVGLLVLVVVTLLFACPAFAQFTQQGGKLVGTDAVGAASQGASVSISADGNTAIVGGFGDNTNAGA